MPFRKINALSDSLRYVLGTILAFVALNAFGGGYYGLSGAPEVPEEWLQGSPFKDYLIPSLFLFVVIGGSFLFASIAVFRRARSARLAATGAAVLVLVWLAIQVAIIGYVSWMQPATTLAAIIVLIFVRYLPKRANAVNQPV